MTGSTFAQLVRSGTKTNSTTLSDADMVLFMNAVQEEIAADIAAEVDENYFDMELYRDLEADIRAYTYATDILKHSKYVAAKLDGTNWTYLTEAFFSEFTTPMRENTYIKSMYAAKKAQFYISGRELFVLSGDDIIAVDDGLKMVAEVYPEAITTAALSSSDDLSIPSSDTQHRLPRQCHPYWAMRVIVKYKESKDKPIPLTKDEQRLEIKRDEMLSKLHKRNQVRSFQSTVPQDDGQDY